MRNVAHFVAVAEPDDGRKIVLDDREVIAMIADVGGQEQGVAPADEPLPALVGRTPEHFDGEFVGPNHLRRIGEALSHLREEREVAVGVRAIVREAGVGELRRAARDGSIDQRDRPAVVPLLGARRRRLRGEADHDAGERGQPK